MVVESMPVLPAGATAAMLAANIPGYSQTPAASPFPDGASMNAGLISQMTAALAAPASMATLAHGLFLMALSTHRPKICRQNGPLDFSRYPFTSSHPCW